MRVRTGKFAAFALAGAAALVLVVMRLTQPTSGATGPVTPNGVAATPTAIATSAPPLAPAVTTRHYISNTGPHVGAAARIGFDLFDLEPDKARIDALGPGQQALVWLGNLDNTVCTPGYSWSAFTAAVDRLAGDPKVYGYYISDEPHPSVCSSAVADIRARADYIRAHAPQQKSFIVVMDASRICGTAAGCEYRELGPAATHVDLYGIDPFPCRVTTGCTPERIDLEVQRALAAGIPASAIVPVYQVFGQACSPNEDKFYQLPTVSDLGEMLARWQALVPTPPFDFAYTWRSKGPACPSLDRAPDLQHLLQLHNEG